MAHKHFQKFISFFQNADVFVWHDEHRIDSWASPTFYRLMRLWTLMNAPVEAESANKAEA